MNENKQEEVLPPWQINIDSPEMWWKAVRWYWDKLHLIVQRFVNLQEIMPEASLRGIENADQYRMKSAGEALLLAKTNKDWKLVRRFFFAAWEFAPDNPSIHQIPCWELLCDLLSEDWVFQPEPEEAKEE